MRTIDPSPVHRRRAHVRWAVAVRRGPWRRIAAGLVGAVALTTALTACGDSVTGRAATRPVASTQATSATQDVCAGIARCRVVTRTDVDGDGSADQVAWIRRSKHVMVARLVTADGQVATRRVDVSLWPNGGAWGGAAYVDGRAGKELLIGSQLGAHTPLYTMLTWRQGGLVVAKTPDGQSRWMIDSALADVIGWWRHTVDGQVRLTYRLALPDKEFRHYRGHDTTYRWDGGWVKGRTVRTYYRHADRAYAVGGFHVRGLVTFPGV